MQKAIVEIDHQEWNGPAILDQPDRMASKLEAGRVLFFPRLAFAVSADERELFSPAILGKSKNVSFNPSTNKLGGTVCTGTASGMLLQMMKRFSDSARQLVDGLLPVYRGKYAMGRASFRPAEIAGRPSSWRKDDTRLHVDAFPSTPTNGNRILRVFSNVNPDGKPRVWRVGEPFESVAEKLAGALRPPMWGSSAALRLFGITKSRRSEYDHMMLQLHDEMKRNAGYQKDVEKIECAFPPGSTWMVFVDAVSHAAISGQYQLEQTFYVPLAAMNQEALAPLRVLERRLGRPLVKAAR